ncbi:hypothetical protein DPMN_143655 [Dreissena polymorpha]|uniref:Uncharacterized protein n=1 Tax=Dreissena polymorpha TaxID=45954 RepID=A0A9D4JLV7_DREPO|nr:hypothetical protein DPMN_143655 [Dreissena polymorpha]
MRLHNLCLDLNVPPIDKEVGDKMDQEKCTSAGSSSQQEAAADRTVSLNVS